MNPVLEFISKYGNGLIIVLGLVLLGFMIWNTGELSKDKRDIKKLLTRNNKKYRINREARSLDEEEDTDNSVTADTVRDSENIFNKNCSLHGVFAQLIPVFPLFGILGTVAGLILNVDANDMSALKDSLGTAMWTTFYGLVFAIGLKIVDAIFPSRIISDVEVMLNDNDRKYELSGIFGDAQGKE
ncbi:MAG: MotA/TolQ/ExbB proton channel family protein [Oscillospiraceae bacterium]|nr:MotA/TolQ/ExbB proton channel family protein [Oscillospiraceae bacterium]